MRVPINTGMARYPHSLLFVIYLVIVKLCISSTGGAQVEVIVAVVDGHGAEVGNEVQVIALEAQPRCGRRLGRLLSPHRLEGAAHSKVDVQDGMNGGGLVAGGARMLRGRRGDGLRGAAVGGPREEVEQILTVDLDGVGWP